MSIKYISGFYIAKPVIISSSSINPTGSFFTAGIKAMADSDSLSRVLINKLVAVIASNNNSASPCGDSCARDMDT